MSLPSDGHRPDAPSPSSPPLSNEHRQRQQAILLHDAEKGAADSVPASETPAASTDDPPTSAWIGFFRSFQRTVIHDNFEARGIRRVPPNHRHDMRERGFAQICMMWVSINLAANNITLGMLGPTVFALPFLDCSLLSVFGMLIGSLPVAYLATFGPRSGNRTMVLTRYIMGWYPGKIVVVLSLVILLGYSVIDAVVAGQMLSAVAGDHGLSIVVGIIVTAVITWAVTTFGYSVFHLYERYAWLPQFAMAMILAGAAGPKFDLSANPSAGVDGRTVAGNRLSFFSLCLSAAITYAVAGADYFVYYPEDTPRLRVFLVTLVGLAISFTPMFIIGIGLGSGVASNPSWAAAYNVSQGALIVEGFRPLGAFGLFCGTLVTLGLISNLVPPTYSSGMDWQVLGRYFERVPRVVWNLVSVVIYAVCAIAGRAHLADIFTNFLALMGYFVSVWIAVFLEEHLLFRKWKGSGWNWDAWDDRDKLPLGFAALVAFLVGWVGAILCMAQVWYIGPIAALLGADGGDLGNYVGFAWAALVYPGLRWLELKRFGR